MHPQERYCTCRGYIISQYVMYLSYVYININIRNQHNKQTDFKSISTCTAYPQTITDIVLMYATGVNIPVTTCRHVTFTYYIVCLCFLSAGYVTYKWKGTLYATPSRTVFSKHKNIHMRLPAVVLLV